MKLSGDGGRRLSNKFEEESPCVVLTTCSRIRKECVSEPSLNKVESGNAEKALFQVIFQQGTHKTVKGTNIFSASNGYNGNCGNMQLNEGPCSRSKSTENVSS